MLTTIDSTVLITVGASCLRKAMKRDSFAFFSCLARATMSWVPGKLNGTLHILELEIFVPETRDFASAILSQVGYFLS